ncbi:hypothetical protein P691DRAFT_780820 [Macrolepiota fuliginosa MF-IS2]|uniref:Ribonuclease H1 N-terminal domain-containing protein n=1 Tax=Macrolepiota fuliginosa MF-IS2 TaxID=1400762 RepID=A0A9P5WZV7_9AGAR|nr:hypothetical protein P691DRAFT_780820 [Macrolepiota fuliginosa MF-IS2]
MKASQDNCCLEELSDSTLIFLLSTKPVKGLSLCDGEALSAQEWKHFYTITLSDAGGDVSSDTDTSTDGDIGSIIAAYAIYYGHKTGVFRSWMEVKRYMKGNGPGNYECFSSIVATCQAWTATLTKGAWGVPRLVVCAGDDKESSEPLVEHIHVQKAKLSKLS